MYRICLVLRKCDGSLKPISPCQPALTRVSRAVRGETLELFYASNKFELFINATNVEIDIPGELQQHMQFIRGVRSMVRNGHFQIMNQLTIHLGSDDDTYLYAMRRFRLMLTARILKSDPYILQKPIMRDFYYDPNSFNEIVRIGGGDIDWSNPEAVHDAVESHKKRLADECLSWEDVNASTDLENIPCARMCEILHVLLGKPEPINHSELVLFLYVYLVDALSIPNTNGITATCSYSLVIEPTTTCLGQS